MVSPTYAGGYRARAVFPWPFLVAVYVIRLMHTRKTRVFLYGVELTRAVKDAGVIELAVSYASRGGEFLRGRRRETHDEHLDSR